MTDDPREVLKAAGVECAEVEKMYVDYFAFGKRNVPWSAMDAVLALARLVAKYKEEADVLRGLGGMMWDAYVPGSAVASFDDWLDEPEVGDHLKDMDTRIHHRGPYA